MFQFASRFRCKDTECIVLRRRSRPVVIELPYLDLALENGAEFYPETCISDSGCWIEISDEEMKAIEDEMDWIFGW